MVKYLAIRLKNELSQVGIQVPIDELEIRLRSTILNFNVSEENAINIVKSQYIMPDKFVKLIKKDLKERNISHNVKNFKEAVNEHFTFNREYDAYCKLNDQYIGKRSVPIKIKDITKKDMHVSIEATLIKLWDSDNESIKQVGLLKDNTGIIRFVSFNGNSAPILELNNTYIFKNLVIDYYNSRFSVLINRSTIIKESVNIE